MLLLFFGPLAVFFVVSFIFWTLIPLSQMKQYLELMNQGKGNRILASEFIFSPYTYSQRLIRYEYLKYLEEQPLEKSHLLLLDEAIVKMEELVAREGSNPYQHIRLGRAFDKKATLLADPSFFKLSNKYYKKAIALSPTRQEAYYAYGLSLVRQKRAEEAVQILNHYPVLDVAIPVSYFYLGLAQFNVGVTAYSDALHSFEIFFANSSQNPDSTVSKKLYEALLRYFYETRDQVRLSVAAARLSAFDPEQQASYLRVVDFVKKHNQVPQMGFEGNRLTTILSPPD
jgi:tetratricopeptide (TPR) repeat protein